MEKQVRERFAALDTLTAGVISGAFRALILSGPPGCGKSYRLEQMLEREREKSASYADESRRLKYERVSGFSRATGLYRLLWEHRESNSVLMVDDCDSIFSDEVALSLLKCACDSSRTRYVAWRSESVMVDDGGEPLPRHFEFRGRFIFVTNLDFEGRSKSDRGLAPHLQALLSRSYYVDLHLTPRELLSRVLDVSTEILKGLQTWEREKILSYIREQAGIMRELSLRTVVKARQIWEQTKNESVFRRIADLTLVSRRIKS